MDHKELRALATTLENGAAADIWYDTSAFGDPDGTFGPLIDTTQEAMISTARFLNRLADVLE